MNFVSPQAFLYHTVTSPFSKMGFGTYDEAKDLIVEKATGAASAGIQSVKAFLDSNPVQHWRERTINTITEFDNTYKGLIPACHFIQDPLDQLSAYIQLKFATLPDFDAWLKDYGHDEWYEQLLPYLLKLPLRAAYSLIDQLYTVIKTILYTAVHPWDSLINLSKQLIILIEQLVQAETWTKSGAGVIGSELGQALILASPISHIAIGIGVALAVAGITVAALREAIQAVQNERAQKVYENVKSQLIMIPDVILTGFFAGLIIGGLKRALNPKITTKVQAEAYAKRLVTQYKLPPYKRVIFTPKGDVVIDWGTKPLILSLIRKQCPHLFRDGCGIVRNFKIIIPAEGAKYAMVDWYSPWYRSHWYVKTPLDNVRTLK